MLKNKIIYLDNAATTWPKPREIEKTCDKFFRECFVSPNRTAATTDFLSKIRQEMLEYFGADSSYTVAFVPSATVGMNVVIQSIIKQKGHIVTTNCEHHCVYRPLYTLKADFNVIDYLDKNQIEHPEKIYEKITPKTKAVIVNHGSNVTGDVFRVEKIGKKLKEYRNLIFVVDVSQTAGIEDISVKDMNADIIVGAAHKHLYGLQGIGFIIYKKDIPLKPLYYGGTGKLSGNLEQPIVAPDMLETGTFNTLGLLALEQSIKLLDAKTRAKYRKHEDALVEYFVNECKDLDKVSIFCGKPNKRTGVVSFCIKGLSPEFMVGPYLKENGNILMRPGLHCAPLIHKAIGTFPDGTNRISFSKFTTKDEVDVLVKLIKKLI